MIFFLVTIIVFLLLLFFFTSAAFPVCIHLAFPTPLAMKTVSQFPAAGGFFWCSPCDIDTSRSWFGGAAPTGCSHHATSLGVYWAAHHPGWSEGWRRDELCWAHPQHHPVLSIRISIQPSDFFSALLQEGASHAHWDVTAGCRAALDAWSARPGLGLAAAQRAKQKPQVEDDAGPARRHLHPESWPAAVGEGRLQHSRLVAAGQGGVRPQILD